MSCNPFFLSSCPGSFCSLDPHSPFTHLDAAGFDLVGSDLPPGDTLTGYLKNLLNRSVLYSEEDQSLCGGNSGMYIFCTASKEEDSFQITKDINSVTSSFLRIWSDEDGFCDNIDLFQKAKTLFLDVLLKGWSGNEEEFQFHAMPDFVHDMYELFLPKTENDHLSNQVKVTEGCQIHLRSDEITFSSGEEWKSTLPIQSYCKDHGVTKIFGITVTEEFLTILRQCLFASLKFGKIDYLCDEEDEKWKPICSDLEHFIRQFLNFFSGKDVSFSWLRQSSVSQLDSKLAYLVALERLPTEEIHFLVYFDELSSQLSVAATENGLSALYKASLTSFQFSVERTSQFHHLIPSHDSELLDTLPHSRKMTKWFQESLQNFLFQMAKTIWGLDMTKFVSYLFRWYSPPDLVIQCYDQNSFNERPNPSLNYFPSVEFNEFGLTHNDVLKLENIVAKCFGAPKLVFVCKTGEGGSKFAASLIEFLIYKRVSRITNNDAFNLAQKNMVSQGCFESMISFNAELPQIKTREAMVSRLKELQERQKILGNTNWTIRNLDEDEFVEKEIQKIKAVLKSLNNDIETVKPAAVEMAAAQGGNEKSSSLKRKHGKI